MTTTPITFPLGKPSIQRIIVRCAVCDFPAARLSYMPFSLMVEYGEMVNGLFCYRRVAALLFCEHPHLVRLCLNNVWDIELIPVALELGTHQLEPEPAKKAVL